ncbi:MAG: EAL domain-containing protein [Granulosicoccus sp.]|nr:EAL domain-containing protein [Granulosicoccus sp.]
MTYESEELPVAAADERYEQVIKHSRIMMVDDEPINMEVLQLHLETEGYDNFISHSDSKTAVDLTRSTLPDILLLDLMMPDVSGFDILKELRADPELKHIPVIVLTSSDDSETKLQALRLGANDFLSKPVDSSELALRLRNTLTAQAYTHQMTHFDGLTGLPNRVSFSARLNNVVHRRPDPEGLAAVLIINLDRFKTINDLVGRKSGDEVLHAFSRRLQVMFGSDDETIVQHQDSPRNSVYRIGGDKFVVLLPYVTDPEDIVATAAPFLSKMEEPFRIVGQEIYVTCSIGISVFPDDGSDEERLVAHAETAMIHAKQRRNNSYAFYSKKMDAKARQLLSLENGMRAAIDNNEFFLMYQPKIHTRTGRISGAEALIRWQHPEYGLVSPERFIPMAESSGLIVPIGDWVLNEACRQAGHWRKIGYGDFRIAVNVSIRQLHEDGYISLVKDALQRHSLSADALTIELTENMIMENASSNVEKLNELKKLGVKLSIDDFGTGYSSLGYLQKFSLDELKIDKSFIQTINSATDKSPIVKAVVSLAHDMGMKVVAEGVETRHQLARVHALRCEEYQGYLCSEPLQSDAFQRLLIGEGQKSA